MVENKENISLDVVMDKPLLPLRDVVVYPHMVIPLFVGREKSKLALEEAMSGDKKILLSSQKRSDISRCMRLCHLLIKVQILFFFPFLMAWNH